MKKIIILIYIFLLLIPNAVAATDEKGTDNIIAQTQDSLNLSGFIKSSKEYTEDVYPDLDIEGLLSSALTGNIDNSQIIKPIFSIFGKELKNILKTLGGILIIVVIHSILKNITDGLENKSVSTIAYYVQYILIVALIMTNFSDVINMVRTSLQSLVRLYELFNSNTNYFNGNYWKYCII